MLYINLFLKLQILCRVFVYNSGFAQFFCPGTPSEIVTNYRHFEWSYRVRLKHQAHRKNKPGLLDPQDGGNIISRNVCNY